MILKGILGLLGILLVLGISGFLIYLLDKYMFNSYFSQLVVRMVEKDISNEGDDK